MHFVHDRWGGGDWRYDSEDEKLADLPRVILSNRAELRKAYQNLRDLDQYISVDRDALCRRVREQIRFWKIELSCHRRALQHIKEIRGEKTALNVFMRIGHPFVAQLENASRGSVLTQSSHFFLRAPLLIRNNYSSYTGFGVEHKKLVALWAIDRWLKRNHERLVTRLWAPPDGLMVKRQWRLIQDTLFNGQPES